MANQRLTKDVVDAASASPTGDTFVWDTELKGFGLRITKGGVKSYVLQYRLRGQPSRRMTIGGHGNPWTITLARREAERRLVQIRQGIDPVEDDKRLATEAAKAKKDAKTFAFDTYADTFVDLYLKENWADSWRSGQGVLKAVKSIFADKSIGQINRQDVATLLDTYADRPGMRKLTHSVLRKLFNWSADRGDIEVSPIARMKAPKTVAARKRVLTPEELGLVWSASADLGGIWRPLFRLLILTLQRREEVAELDWSEIDIEKGVWLLPGERAKNDQAHRVPLNSLAIAELKACGPKAKGFVFTTTGETAVSGFSKAKKRLDELMLEIMRKRASEAGDDPEEVLLTPWRLHDLRRTGATNLQALGVPVEVTEAILNHISGTTGGIAGVYNLFRYDPQKQKALDAWARHLERLFRKPAIESNIVLLSAVG